MPTGWSLPSNLCGKGESHILSIRVLVSVATHMYTEIDMKMSTLSSYTRIVFGNRFNDILHYMSWAEMVNVVNGRGPLGSYLGGRGGDEGEPGADGGGDGRGGEGSGEGNDGCRLKVTCGGGDVGIEMGKMTALFSDRCVAQQVLAVVSWCCVAAAVAGTVVLLLLGRGQKGQRGIYE